MRSVWLQIERRTGRECRHRNGKKRNTHAAPRNGCNLHRISAEVKWLFIQTKEGTSALRVLIRSQVFCSIGGGKCDRWLIRKIAISLRSWEMIHTMLMISD